MKAAVLSFNAAIIGLIWAAVLGLIHDEREEAISSAIVKNDNFAFAFEQYTIRNLQTASLVIHDVIDSYRGTGGVLGLTELHAHHAADDWAFKGLVVSNHVGDAVTTAHASKALQRINIADREHFRVHAERDTRRVFIGRPVLDRATGELVLPLSMRINSENGTFAGTAIVLIDPGRFTELLQKATLKEHDILALVGLDGIIRARRNGALSTAGEDITQSVLFELLEKSPVGSYHSVSVLDGVQRYASYRKVPGYPLVVVVGAAEHDVLESFHLRRQRYLTAAVISTVAIALFALLLLTALAEHGRSESALRAQARRLRELSRQLLRLEENERRSLARELHDTVGQQLTALGINLGLIRCGVSEGQGDAIERLDDSQNILQDAAVHLREVMGQLRPPGLDELGLMAALSIHAVPVARRSGMKLHMAGIEPRPRLPPTTAIALFRIAQEALNNIVKHAGATQITIDLCEEQDLVRMTVSDNGRGFDPTRQARAGSGLGLVTMRERAEAIGGHITIDSIAGDGTRVVVEVPRRTL